MGDAGLGAAGDEHDRGGALFFGEEGDVRGGWGETAGGVEVGCV